jgi:hypothetical protein
MRSVQLLDGRRWKIVFTDDYRAAISHEPNIAKEYHLMSEYLRTVVTIPILYVLLLSMAACGKKEEPKAPAQAPAVTAEAKGPQPTPAAPPQAPPETPSAASSPAPEASAPAAQPAPPAPQAKPALATADGEKPGSRVEVQELRRASGGTVMLRFTMINEGDKDLSLYSGFIQPGTNDHSNISGVHLLDPVGKKKYLVVRDSQGKCDCSQGLGNVAPKSRINLWARFPAPPDNVEKIGIVVPHFSPMDDVSLSK